MRRAITLLLFVGAVRAQTVSPTGKWISHLKFSDQNNYDRLELSLDGTKLTGKLGNNAFEGTFQSGRIEGAVKPNPSFTITLTGTLAGDQIRGTATIPGQAAPFTWEASREPARSAAPQTHTFEPTVFQHFFADSIAPVLRINPGDTVKTWAVDAGGTDPKGVRRTSGGNPLTGPFYIEGAFPGDTLAVHFTRIRLNRDTAGSGALIVNSALNALYVQQRKPVEGYNSNWKLDRAAGFASLEKPTEAMKDYRVPLAPMLGCVGTAPAQNQSYRSGYVGNFGGNMDYRELREGVTVFLPVYAPGALLFVGDGHAAQGAGELTGDALETSMDIEFTVDLEVGGAPLYPRMENDDYLMASGIAGDLNEAFRQATTNLVRWLERRYGLNAAEVSSVLGTSMVYDVAEVVDPQVHIVAKAPKSTLAGLKRVN
jgi:acetamidase/formamidase